jgi:phosphoglycolate phosphatase-like HAD superfamily hydrolase
MGDYVEEHRDQLCATVLPEVRETLEHLRARGAVLSVATGNLARIGKAKLEHAGLMHFFEVDGFSDGLETRADVFERAASRLRERLHAGAAFCVVGDTPADVQAARQNRLPVIAVATGIFSVEQLRAEGPELCVGSLADLSR